ncbi:hypothetical protein NQ314_005469 [Rhamnusium bicolor]|uniref:Beta-glucuronidase n=1 Tax=Rhamnusium bicolor TaxID=1586634 RepID=A0AAV8ZJR2_9CUCU|nr:hypothetical protein NQ314_005469 [Rhamnusium bicolor]
MKEILFISILTFVQLQCDSGILYPRASAVRELLSLNGLWKFSLSKSNDTKFEDGNWSLYNLDNDEDLELMPVPASYNDISTNDKVRDHVGIVRYQRNFIVPRSWAEKRIWLRFSSVCYAAQVYINGKLAITHDIGHLPFGSEITSFLNLDIDNDITVLVNNILTGTTIPQGSLNILPSGRLKQSYPFDFFNYAGIDRPVVLYTTAQTYIDDIKITTEIRGTSGFVNYNITIVGDHYNHSIAIVDKGGRQISVSYNQPLNGSLLIPNVNLWWPYLMNDQPGYLYTLKQPFGVRELSWDNSTFNINGKPLYLRGFGRHEDSDIRGKGLDLPLIIRDHNLIKWIGANSYRTSHYPYAEEIMDLADSLGIMIIDEVPAVAIEQIVAHAKSLDNTRPITVVNNVAPNEDHSGQFLDILSMNKYNAWYENSGDLDIIVPNFISQAEAWHTKHNRPVLVTEYGADTCHILFGLKSFNPTSCPSTSRLFDELRAKGWLVGEMIWNFADFRTEQSKQRQPKASAHLMRQRYWALAELLDNATLPLDLNNYIVEKSTKIRDEF